MATDARPLAMLQNAIIRKMTVKAASSTTIYMPQTLDAATMTISDSAAGDNPFCIALETGVAGAPVQVALLSAGAVVPVQVGTAGATAGKYGEVGTTGLTDRTLGGGTAVRYLAGKFLQTGVSADVIGLLVGNFASVSS